MRFFTGCLHCFSEYCVEFRAMIAEYLYIGR